MSPLYLTVNMQSETVKLDTECVSLLVFIVTRTKCAGQWKTGIVTSLICDNCHNSKLVIFQEKLLKILKCYNFLQVQRRHKCSPAASFANCVMTLYLLKVHLQTFLSVPITQKYQILSCDTLVTNERYMLCTF